MKAIRIEGSYGDRLDIKKQGKNVVFSAHIDDIGNTFKVPKQFLLRLLE